MPKFDCVIMNPPYNHGLCNKFLEKSLQFADNVVSVQPSGFITNQNKDKKLIEKLNNYDLFVEEVNGNAYFDAHFTTQVAIFTIDTTNKGKIHIYGNEYDSCEEIYLYNKDKQLTKFKEIIKNEKDTLSIHLKKNSYIETNIENYCIRISKFRGHTCPNGKRDDFLQ